MSNFIPWPVPLLTESVHVHVCGLCVCSHACVYVAEKEAYREIPEILDSGPVSWQKCDFCMLSVHSALYVLVAFSLGLEEKAM